MLNKIIRARIDNQAKQTSGVKIYAQHGDDAILLIADVLTKQNNIQAREALYILIPVSSLCDCLLNVCCK